MKTAIEKRRYLNTLKISFYAHKIKNLYYCTVWENDKYFTTGKIGYLNYKDCIIETENIFYQKYKNKVLNING